MLREEEIFLTTPSFVRIHQVFSEEMALPTSPPVNCPDITALAQPSVVLLPIGLQDKTEGEFFLQHLRSSTGGSYSLLVCPASEPLQHESLVLILPSLISGPGLGLWPE